MKRSIKYNRRRADFGLSAAIIAAAASMASAGIGAMGAKKARRQQAAIENYNNALIASENLSENVQQALDNQLTLEKQNNITARCGGRKKLKYGGSTGVKESVMLSPDVIADAKGNFIEIQPGVYYSFGPTHEKGGINVDKITKKGNKKPILNMEGNEIIDTSNPNKVTVLTDRLIDPRTGMSYVKEVLNGYPAKEVGDRQEKDKTNFRYKLRCGGRKKALWGWNEEINNDGVTGGDIYSAGASALANIGSGLMNYFAYKNMEKPSAPTLIGRNSLLTRYNIAPRLTILENERYNTNGYINRNSTSSASARNSIAKTNLQYALAANQLYGEKTNKEEEMINANIRYLDEGRRLRADKMSDYRNILVDFNNQRRAGMASAITDTVSGIAANVNQFADNIEQHELNKHNAYLTVATAKPEVLEYLKQLDPVTFRKLFGIKKV